MNTSFSYLTLISQWTGLKPFKVLSSAAERGREQTFWLVYNTRDQMEKGRKGESEYFDRQSDPKNQTTLTPLIPALYPFLGHF